MWPPTATTGTGPSRACPRIRTPSLRSRKRSPASNPAITEFVSGRGGPSLPIAWLCCRGRDSPRKRSVSWNSVANWDAKEHGWVVVNAFLTSGLAKAMDWMRRRARPRPLRKGRPALPGVLVKDHKGVIGHRDHARHAPRRRLFSAPGGSGFAGGIKLLPDHSSAPAPGGAFDPGKQDVTMGVARNGRI